MMDVIWDLLSWFKGQNLLKPSEACSPTSVTGTGLVLGGAGGDHRPGSAETCCPGLVLVQQPESCSWFTNSGCRLFWVIGVWMWWLQLLGVMWPCWSFRTSCEFTLDQETRELVFLLPFWTVRRTLVSEVNLRWFWTSKNWFDKELNQSFINDSYVFTVWTWTEEVNLKSLSTLQRRRSR